MINACGLGLSLRVAACRPLGRQPLQMIQGHAVLALPQRRLVAHQGPRHPTIAYAKQQPREVYELSNEALAIASRDVKAHDLHQERLIRDIMAVDGVEYVAASEKMKEIFAANRKGMFLRCLPVEAGCFLFAGLALGAFPLVFHFETSQMFADFVQTSYDQVPEAGRWRDHGLANTGTWSWAWMEPIIGTCSFSILCLQLLRGQMKKLALNPYTNYLRSRRANRLASWYPQYTRTIVKDFGRSQPLRGKKWNPLGKKW